MIPFRAAVFAAFCLCAAAVSATADEVTLTSREGTVTISGELLGYDGEFYRLSTQYGILTVDGTRVECGGEGCPDVDAYVAEVGFAGAQRMGEVLMPALIESFAIRNGLNLSRDDTGSDDFTYVLRDPEADRVVGRFGFRLHSSAEGFADLVAEEADIVMSLRPVLAREARLARTAGLGDLVSGDRARIVALDAVVPLVALSNPVRDISLEDLRAAFRGEIGSWAELGGPDQPIALHAMAPGMGIAQSATVDIGEDVLESNDAITRHESARDLASAVADDPDALGIGSFIEQGDAVPLALRGPCGTSSQATETTLKTEDYPLTAPMFLYTPAVRLPRLAREFMSFAGSPAAQPVIERAGFVDQFPRAIPLDDQGERFANAIRRAGVETDLQDLQQLVSALSGKSRLTLTFRFENASSALDAQSRSNVALLSAALERGVFDQRSLVFVGFGDGAGPAGINRRLSNSRARTVRDAVRASAESADPDRVNLRVEAFGEAMPMACDETAWGRRVNRRVEVWIE